MSDPSSFAVGLSGGVDSALAAALLVRQGHRVVGLTMKIWRLDDEFGGSRPVRAGRGKAGRQGCYGPGEDEDIATCERLATALGIEYRVIDLSKEYESLVLDYFRREYRAGRTPNPCIVCNREMKFGFLLERARAAGLEFDAFATGHYARVLTMGGVHWLARARSVEKDQSYFLHGLDSDLLATVRFPLGELTKEAVRAEARALGLEVANKAESQDFVSGGDYAPLFAESPPEPGDFVDESGSILGRHRGLPFYTPGQRRGLGISIGTEALYVQRIDPVGNRVVLGSGKGLFSEGLLASQFRFHDPGLAPTELRAFAKVRLAHRPAPCLVRRLGGKSVQIRFDSPERALAPGQSVVIYHEDGRVLGGGTIDAALEHVD